MDSRRQARHTNYSRSRPAPPVRNPSGEHGEREGEAGYPPACGTLPQEGVPAKRVEGVPGIHQDSIRLSKFLAHAGVSSRRKADELIKAGKVRVNNTVVLEPFALIQPHKAIVSIDNKVVTYHVTHKYIALHKPVGYLSDLKDTQDRELARALLDDKERLYPVGRLDYQSEGLMFFTNDGAFAQRVMHPRYEVEKEYLVKLRGKLDSEELQKLVDGVMIQGERYAFDLIKLMRAEKQNAWYRVIIHEGKNRLIRKAAEALSHPVVKLRRVRIGPVVLGAMRPGEHRHLTPREIDFFLTQQPPKGSSNARSRASV
jgi:23S rRNA pseudouridine2605 synthase